MNLVLLGPPGAGKGTQATVISKKYKISHISTGEILRNRIKDGSELGKQVKSYVESGKLVPDDLVIQMVQERLQKEDCAEGFILDGFPRNENQAEVLEACLKGLNKQLDSALNFDASEHVILERLTGRRVCEKCSGNFHIKNMPPKVEGICDGCGSGLVQRKDDNEETIKKRLAVYRESAQPLLDYYEKKGILKTIPADRDYREIEKILTEYFSSPR
ncbi:MAG: adenylate kinase [Candidatus Omnitrophica bacterium]|nr:adenylate kinase [Candidatus Omnitrophota bacterium]